MILSKFSIPSLIIFSFALTSCGGGGGGGGGSSSGPGNGGDGGGEAFPENLYTGSTAAGTVNPENAKSLLLSAIEVIDFIEQLAIIPTGNIFDRIYLTLPEDEPPEDFFSGEETVCETGRYDTADNRNSEGIGEISLRFRDCSAAGETLDGLYKLNISRSAGNITALTTLEKFRLHSAGENVDITVNGEISQTLQDETTFLDLSPWTGDIVIEYANRGTQTFAKNLVRSGQSHSNYQVAGEFYHSTFGRFQLSGDTADNVIVIEGNSSSLTSEYTRGGYKADVEGYSVVDYFLRLDVDGDGEADQAVELPTKSLVNYFVEQNTVPVVDIQGTTEIEKGQPINLSLSIQDEDNDFISTNWRIKNWDGTCQPVLEVNSGWAVEVRSDCSGNVSIEVTVSDGRSETDHETKLFFYRYLPDVEFVDPPVTLAAGQSISVPVMENNPEEGPFSYGLAFAVDGASVQSDGTLTWNGTGVPRVSHPLEVTFGLSATNDRSTVETFTASLNFDDYVPPMNSGFPTPIDRNYGGVDLEPENPEGDIVFFRGHSDQQGFAVNQLVKYSKSENSFRLIDVADSPLSLRYLDINNRAFTYADWNGDQIPDLLSGASNQNSANLVVFDLENEIPLFNEVVFSLLSTAQADIVDVHFLDIDQSGEKMFVFLLKSGVLLQDSSWAVQGVYAYEAGSFEPELLLDLSSDGFDTGSLGLIVADLDGDSIQELIVSGQRFREGGHERIFVFKKQGEAFRLQSSFATELPLAFVDMLLVDADNDESLEIVSIFTHNRDSSSNPKRFCNQQPNITEIYALDGNLNIESQRTMEDLLISGVSVPPTGWPSGNVYFSGQDCAADQAIFSYLNLYWGREIWRKPFNPEEDSSAWDSSRNSVTPFLGSDGRVRLAVGGFREVLVTQ